MVFRVHVAQVIVSATTTVGVFGNLYLNYKQIKCQKDQK